MGVEHGINSLKLRYSDRFGLTVEKPVRRTWCQKIVYDLYLEDVTSQNQAMPLWGKGESPPDFFRLWRFLRLMKQRLPCTCVIGRSLTCPDRRDQEPKSKYSTSLTILH